MSCKAFDFDFFFLDERLILEINQIWILAYFLISALTELLILLSMVHGPYM